MRILRLQRPLKMRRTFSIILNVLAGFFFYAAMLLGFIKDPSAFQWGIVCFFLLVAMIPLTISFSLMRFRQWKREAGIVLMSASGVTVFIVFSLACMYMTEESQKMIPQDVWLQFSAYPSGFGMILTFAGIGYWLFKVNKESVVETQATEA